MFRSRDAASWPSVSTVEGNEYLLVVWRMLIQKWCMQNEWEDFKVCLVQTMAQPKGKIVLATPQSPYHPRCEQVRILLALVGLPGNSIVLAPGTVSTGMPRSPKDLVRLIIHLYTWNGLKGYLKQEGNYWRQKYTFWGSSHNILRRVTIYHSKGMFRWMINKMITPDGVEL